MWSFWSEFCANPLSMPEPFDASYFGQADLCAVQSNTLIAQEDIHLTVYDASGRRVAQRFLFTDQSWEIKGCGLHLVVAKSPSGQTQQLKVFVKD